MDKEGCKFLLEDRSGSSPLNLSCLGQFDSSTMTEMKRCLVFGIHFGIMKPRVAMWEVLLP